MKAVKLPMWILFSCLIASVLSGCHVVLLSPEGAVAAEQLKLIITALILMLIVVIPVIILSIVFAWRYRASNTRAKYMPDWSHNVKLEIVWWAVPCIIILILAIIAWITAHSLDPYKPMKGEKKPLLIQAISLDWKWLFIYPEQHIATINYLQIPEQTPIAFKITADAPMNSLWIPSLGGQIYSMPGMQTKLHLIANTTGVFEGHSSNFSGPGFSSMTFDVKSTTQDVFDQWVASVQRQHHPLTEQTYAIIAKPSENNPVQYFSPVSDHLFEGIMDKYMMPMSMPMNQ